MDILPTIFTIHRLSASQDAESGAVAATPPPPEPPHTSPDISPDVRAHEYEYIQDLHIVRSHLPTSSPPAGEASMAVDYTLTQCPAYAATVQVTEM